MSLSRRLLAVGVLAALTLPATVGPSLLDATGSAGPADRTGPAADPVAGWPWAGAAGAGTSPGASRGTAASAGSMLDLPALAIDAAALGRLPPPVPRPHAAVPEDRYAMAGGCYRARSLVSGRYLSRTAQGFAASAATGAAEPLWFQALDLGKYLLFASRSDFVAAAADPLPAGGAAAVRTVEGYVRGTGDQTLKPVRDPVLGAADSAQGAVDQASAPVRSAARGASVVAAARPSAAAEWVVRQAGPGTFVLQLAVDDGSEEDPGPLDPPIYGTLTAAPDGTLRVQPGASTGPEARFVLHRDTGCAAWPEVEVNVRGPLVADPTPFGRTAGYLDAHLHGMAFEFLGGRARCGRPWHPYGVTYALVDCPDHAAGGHGAALEQVLSGQQPGSGHDTVGWPTFGYWPRYSSLTHEQVYYKWLERAWRGGLRMYTNLLVENGVLCQVYPLKKNSCNEMDAVRLQAVRLHQFIRYIDAQMGGPGRGWLQVVTDPFQSRRVINSGRLAVVMGIEVSVPFDCGEYLEQPQCTPADIAARLDEVRALGVRQMELTNKFDNALTGVTGDSGTTGVLVNGGNHLQTGHFWKLRTCDASFAGTEATDKSQYDAPDAAPGGIGRDAIFGAVLQLAGASGAAPAYAQGPHCNIRGLTALGRLAITGLIRRGMVFDPDHMSALSRREAMAFVAGTGYSGVVSSHSWGDEPTYTRVLRQGGLVTPHAGDTTSFVKEWRTLRHEADPRFPFAIGWGSDINGFSTQGAPRLPAPGQGVRYPFVGFGGVVVDRQVSGRRTYDINTDGVDHYGLYPDWVADAALVAGRDAKALMADLRSGPEAYLQLWERASGIRPDSCRADVTRLGHADLARLRPGMTPEEVVLAVGQPHWREGDRFGYCAERARVTVTFTPSGRLLTLRSA